MLVICVIRSREDRSSSATWSRAVTSSTIRPMPTSRSEANRVEAGRADALGAVASLEAQDDTRPRVASFVVQQATQGVGDRGDDLRRQDVRVVATDDARVEDLHDGEELRVDAQEIELGAEEREADGRGHQQRAEEEERLAP